MHAICMPIVSSCSTMAHKNKLIKQSNKILNIEPKSEIRFYLLIYLFFKIVVDLKCKIHRQSFEKVPVPLVATFPLQSSTTFLFYGAFPLFDKTNCLCYSL